MLILTRRSDESIIINNNITIKILKIQGSQVQIGISAPKDISVFRQELYTQVSTENQKALQTSIKNLTILSQKLNTKEINS